MASSVVTQVPNLPLRQTSGLLLITDQNTEPLGDDSFTIVVKDSTGADIVVSVDDLVFTVYDPITDAVVLEIGSSGISVINSNVTIDFSNILVPRNGTYRWVLWNLTATPQLNEILVKGAWVIRNTAGPG